MNLERFHQPERRKDQNRPNRRDVLWGLIGSVAGALSLLPFEQALASMTAGEKQKEELLQVIRYVYEEDKSALAVFNTLKLTGEKIEILHDVTLNALRTVCRLNDALSLRQGLAHPSFPTEARKQLATFTVENVPVFSLHEQKALSIIFDRIRLRAQESI